MAQTTPEALALGLTLALAAARAEESGDHAPVDVQVHAGQVSVSQDPVSTSPSEGALVREIATDGFRFAQNGIDIDAPGQALAPLDPFILHK